MTTKKYAAEAIGTFWLTFAGCGSAVIAAGFPQVGIGLLGVSLTFGLSVVTMMSFHARCRPTDIRSFIRS